MRSERERRAGAVGQGAQRRGGDDPSEVVDRVALATGEYPETVEQSVLDFLDDLVARGLLTFAFTEG